MPRSSSTWQRVGKARRCPICGRADWCLFAGGKDNPEAVICARVESPKKCGQAGWLHHLRDSAVAWCPRLRRIELSAAWIAAQTTDFGKLAAEYPAAVRPEKLVRHAADLGVTHESLLWLGIGWSSKDCAWTFPMVNCDERVLGIRLRRTDGRKWSVRGGREGLFLVNGLTRGGRLLIAEGPTDVAALLSLEFDAVGRPNCSGGIKLLVELVQRLKAREVVVVADGDAPGQRGAGNLASVLLAYCPVKIITPPVRFKDARAWGQGGATTADVQAVIDAAPVRKLAIRIARKAGGQHGR